MHDRTVEIRERSNWAAWEDLRGEPYAGGPGLDMYRSVDAWRRQRGERELRDFVR